MKFQNTFTIEFIRREHYYKNSDMAICIYFWFFFVLLTTYMGYIEPASVAELYVDHIPRTKIARRDWIVWGVTKITRAESLETF
jgi:hypothetical protein